MQRMVRITAVECLETFWVRLSFTDGTQRDVNLDPYLRGPIFQPLRDDARQFSAVRVDTRLGTITWPNGADIDPDVLYHNLQPEWMSHDQIKAPK
jgi:hypothetical protein